MEVNRPTHWRTASPGHECPVRVIEFAVVLVCWRDDWTPISRLTHKRTCMGRKGFQAPDIGLEIRIQGL